MPVIFTENISDYQQTHALQFTGGYAGTSFRYQLRTRFVSQLIHCFIYACMQAVFLSYTLIAVFPRWDKKQSNGW